MSLTVTAPSSFPSPFPPSPTAGSIPGDLLEMPDISPSVFKRYAVAWLAIVLYDTIATFPDEYSHMWKASWTSVKVFFLLNRWGSLVAQVSLFAISTSTISPSLCSRIYWYGALGGIYIAFVCSVIVSLRVWALYERSRKILTLLAFLIFAQLCLMIGPATQLRPTNTPVAILKQLKLPGCLTRASGAFSSGEVTIFWVTMLAFDSIILGLTLYKSIKVTRAAGRIPIIQKLVRDGVQYFVLITLSNTISVIFTIQNIKPFLKPFHTPASLALLSLLCSRLVLSLFVKKGTMDPSWNPSAGLRTPRHLWQQGQSNGSSGATKSSESRMSESLSRVPLLSSNGQAQQTADYASLTLQNLAASYGALQGGKLPTSEQLVRYVQAGLRSSVLQPEIGGMLSRKAGGAKLSKRGKEVVVDTRKVLEAVNRLILEKNDDDKIQRFIWQASQADIDVDVDVSGNLELPDVPVPSKKEVKQAAGSLHQLFSLLLTSSELRNLIGDGINLFRDVFADAAEGVADVTIKATRASKKAAKKTRPSEKERKEHHIPGEGLYWEDAAMNVQNFRKQVKRDVEDKRDETLRQGVKKARAFKDYLEEELPTDAVDAIKERFKAIINEIQDQPEYSEAINTLSGLARKYFELAKEEIVDAAQATTANIKLDGEPNQEAENAVGLLRQIVESFTGDIGPALKSASALYKHLENDERFQKIWTEFEELVDRAINDPGYVTSEKASRRFEKMYDEARSIVNENAEWKKDANNAISEAQKLLNRAANDKALIALGDACEKLGESTFDFAETGVNLVGAGGGDLWKDVSQVFLPRLLGALKEVPLPRVEFTSEDLDLIVDNIRFESASFIPDGAHFRSVLDYTTQKGYAAYASEGNVQTTLSFAGLRMAAKNISYYINKKSGWVGLEDSGLLDIYLGSEHPDADNGLDVTLVLENADENDRESFFKLRKVDVDITGFDIAIRQSAHPVRNWLARGAVRSFMEIKVKEVLEEQIAAGFAELDKTLFKLKYKAAGAAYAAADPLSFIRAILTPTSLGSSSLISEVSKTGITKVDAKGQWILAIGVEDELLPGRLTGLGQQGRDVVGRKRQVESLMEEGQAEILSALGAEDAEDLEDGARQVGDALGDAADEERKKARRAAYHAKKEEQRRSGWKSPLFDL